MGKDASVAPRERVNITYKPAVGDARQQVELPLKMLVLADLTGSPDPRPIEERPLLSLDKDNFNKVMAEQRIQIEASVPNRLSESGDERLNVSLQVRSLADLSPDGIATQVPELQSLLALRAALVALKGPLGNTPAFRRKIQGLLSDESSRARLLKELGVGEKP